MASCCYRVMVGAVVVLSLWAGTNVCHAVDTLPCVDQMVPCQDELQSARPHPTCCTALEEMLDDNPDCLCAVFFNKDVLQNFNLTQAVAIQLPINCGLKPNVTHCHNLGYGNDQGESPAPAPLPEKSGNMAIGRSWTKEAVLLVVGVLMFTLVF